MTPQRLAEWRTIAKTTLHSAPPRVSILRSELAELIDEVDAARTVARLNSEWCQS